MDIIGFTAREVFEWHDGPTGETIVFDVTGLRQLFDQHPALIPLTPVALTFNLYAFVQPRVDATHARALRDDQINEPALIVEWADGKHLLIDGAHRVWRRWHEHREDIWAYMIPRALWRRFILN